MNPRTLIDIEPASSSRRQTNAPRDRPAAADAGPFAGWILRPNVDGRLGWETPNLPERLRWSAHAV